MEVQRIWLQTKILNFMFKVEWSLRGHFGGRYHDLELESYKLCSHQSRVRTIERYKLPGIPASCRPSSTAVGPMCKSVWQGSPDNNNTTDETQDPTECRLWTSIVQRTLPFLSFFQTDLDFSKISNVENFFINLEFFSLFMLMSF